jgi:monovalent cation:H+ antiporter, CPA1 family
MTIFHIISILIFLSAVFSYLNFRYLKLPPSIGLMGFSLLFSMVLMAIGSYNPSFKSEIVAILDQVNFSELLLEIMLSFMLFAGSIHINIEDLKEESPSIAAYATVSVVISTFIIGYGAYFVLGLFGIEVSQVHALLFGALISPTDPIAVLSIIKTSGISKSLQTKIAGESLFNDGVAVVVFTIILQLSGPGAELSAKNIVFLLITEAAGGILLGFILGYAGYKLIASIDNYKVEVLITLAIVMGGYTLSHYIHVSGPLAMVAAGLIIGNPAKRRGMSDATKEYIDKFWELLDEILNAILFVLIGLELVIIPIENRVIFLSLVLLLLSLLARYISILVPSLLISLREKISQHTMLILTWGGLRGGISIALALSIPSGMNKEIWVMVTYVIVCFSILVQGLTIGKLAGRKAE